MDIIVNGANITLTKEEETYFRINRELTLKATEQNAPFLTFNWVKAILLIFAYDIKNAYFGLKNYWEHTKVKGLENKSPIYPTDTSRLGYCITSNWTIPQLYDADNGQFYDCYHVLPDDKTIINHFLSHQPWWDENTLYTFDFIQEMMEDLS